MKMACLIWCALPFLGFAGSNPTNLSTYVIQTGPRAGQLLREKSATPSPKEASIPQAKYRFGLGSDTNVEAELSSWRYEYTLSARTREIPVTFYDFRVRGTGTNGFLWSCCAPDLPTPHRFQIFTTPSGKSYASYVRRGVHIYRLTGDRDPLEMRRLFLEDPETDAKHPDALPVLGMDSLEPLGVFNMIGLGSQTWNITVDGLEDVNGELHVRVHGAKAQPELTFALRKDRWELMPASTLK
jgi:hypothetical protein